VPRERVHRSQVKLSNGFFAPGEARLHRAQPALRGGEVHHFARTIFSLCCTVGPGQLFAYPQDADGLVAFNMPAWTPVLTVSSRSVSLERRSPFLSSLVCFWAFFFTWSPSFAGYVPPTTARSARRGSVQSGL